MRICINRLTASTVLALAFCAPVWSQVVFPAGSTIDLANGNFNSACLATTLQGELILGGGSMDTGSFIFDNATVSGSGGTLNISGNLAALTPLNLSTSSVVLSDVCTAGVAGAVTGSLVVQNLSFVSTGSGPATFILPAGHNITVLGTITLGTSGNPVLLTSSGPGIAYVALGPNATLSNPSGSVVPRNVQIGAAAPHGATRVPTLNFYGLLLLSMLLAGFAIRRQR